MRLLLLLLLLPATAPAESLTERVSFSRNADFFATGATLAADTDGDTNVDLLLSQATVQVTAGDLVPGATIQQALLYWAGSVEDMDDCDPSAPSAIDDQVELLTPDAPFPAVVAAQACYCDAAGAMAYDVQACRADVTGLVQDSGTALVGAWTLTGFTALIDNGSTHNASFAIVLFYTASELPNRRLTLYDGLQRMNDDSGTFSLTGLDVDDPPSGDLTWYVLEGDIGGSSDEEVSVQGWPGGGPLVLSDAVNPPNNPMNRTINTTVPPQEDVIGVDIDSFDISAALAPADTSLDVTWTADSDKWWAVFEVVGVNVFYAAFSAQSSLRWSLIDDADGNDVVGPGDTLRYMAELVNGGDGNADLDVELPLPPEAAGGAVVELAGGVNTSSSFVLSVDGVPVPAGATALIEFDVIVADVPDGSEMEVVLDYVVRPEGALGQLVADPALVHRDGDGDGIFDWDDPCPDVPGTTCVDDDDDAVGADDDDDRSPPRQSGCSCRSAGSRASGWPAVMLLGVAGAAARRRTGDRGQRRR